MIKWVLRTTFVILFLYALFFTFENGFSWVTDSKVFQNIKNIGNKTYKVIDKKLDEELSNNAENNL